MDIAIAKKSPSIIKRYWPWLVAVSTVFVALNYLQFLSEADFVVDGDFLVFDDVKRGEFLVSVRGTGVLVPNNIQWLSASVDARVERVLVKPGKIVKQGDLIVELSNPLLVQSLEETKWELRAKTSESKASRVVQESMLLDQKSVVLDAQLNYESKKLKLDAQTKLFLKSTGTVSQIEYQQTRLEAIQLKKRWVIQQARLEKMAEIIIAQNDARTARLEKMQKTLERAQQQVNALKVYASINSVVQDIPLSAGQRVVIGGNIAKLAQQNDLIAEIQIPELQIREVAVGQSVMIDTRNDKVKGIVSRIDPAVVNGFVQVDVIFNSPLPKDARPDLTVDGEIITTKIIDTLFVSRPLFSQSQSTASLYRISLDGNFAERIQVKLGKGSVNQIQIVEGLNIGEKIIISDPTDWDNYEKIRIN
ncbi:MAG: HlyD family efflux transporter periplasmic adaptor subunit [Colwellia sp.]|nr:HlyD family efflux transporter periplasmic adaptor subunit [Colwellia sp.]